MHAPNLLTPPPSRFPVEAGTALARALVLATVAAVVVGWPGAAAAGDEGPGSDPVVRARGTPPAQSVRLARETARRLKEGLPGGDEGFDSCLDATKVVCAYDRVRHVDGWTFEVRTPTPIVATATRLEPLGGASPDPVLVLLRCRTASCEDGDVAAIDDDGAGGDEPRAARIEVRDPRPGTYRLVVASFHAGVEGFADVSLAWDGAPPVVRPRRLFGGWTVRDQEMRGGDVLFAGKNGNGQGMPGDPEYADLTLLWLGTGSLHCAGDCGPFLASDDERFGEGVSRLPRLRCPAAMAPARGRVLVGVANDLRPGGMGARVNARLVHLRRPVDRGGAWEGEDRRDADGDGLPFEVEARLGTCDGPDDATPAGVGVEGFPCEAFRRLVDSVAPGTWSPVDSDNDGLDDAGEVFRVVAACEHRPRGPFGEAGACRRLSILDPPGCPTPWCSVLDLSARSDPDPAVYDVFVVSDYWRCTGPGCGHGDAGHSHAVTAGQQGLLARFWHDDPATCWDGSAPPCPDASRDLPYRVNLHLYGGGPHGGRPHDLPDDTFGDEVNFNGAWGVAGYFDRWFRGAGRYTNTFRYVLATHWGGGQTPSDPARTMVWGNDGEAAVLRTFSHETGHMLGLPDLVSHDPDGTACPEAHNRCDPGGTVWTQNPVLASVMNYGYSRLPPKGPSVPGQGDPPFAGCDASHLRYSKGLNRTQREARLCETNPGQDAGCRPGAADWRTVKLAREVACFDDFNHCDGTSAYRPVCAGGACTVDWDALRTDGTQPPEPYAFDVSYGRLRSKGACDGDDLADRDEWRAIVAKGRDGLRAVSYRDVAIYQDTFNGGRSANIAGWDLPVEATVGFDAPDRPANECAADADCGANGRCDTEVGRCACSADGDCPAKGTACDLRRHLCRDRNASADPPGGIRPPREAAVFGGPGAGTHLRLRDEGADGALAALAATGAFTAILELRFDGFAAGQDRQAVVRSGAFSLEVRRGRSGPVLSATVNGGRVLERPLDTGRWVRVTWGAGGRDGDHQLHVVPWDGRLGRFDAGALADHGCSRRAGPRSLDPAGDVWLGFDGADDRSRLRGRIDSVSLLDYRFGRCSP